MKENQQLFWSGALALLAAFSLSFLFQNLWVGFFAAFGVGVIWLWLLDRKVVSKLQSGKRKTTVRVFMIVLVVLQLAVAYQYYSKGNWQKELLTEIRVVIVDGISQVEMEQSLQQTLRYYNSMPEDQRNSLADAFRELHAEHLNEDGTWTPETPNEDGDLKFTYSIATPDSIILAVSASFSKGEDPDFVNTNQRNGMFQSRAILTHSGVQYERQN
jgi:branched-subunit amino acid ABC-type transport system permease component